MNTIKQLRETRYILTKKRVSLKEATAMRKAEEGDIQYQIGQLRQELKELRKSPLNRTRFVYQPVHPGEKGYAKADFALNQHCFSGKLTWETPKKP